MFLRSTLLRGSGVLAFTCLTLLPCPARASTGPTPKLPQLLEQADLVFAGVVVSVETRSSSVLESGDVVLPHSFVTFRIEELVKGKSSAGDTITLRFLGGHDDSGRVLTVAGIPHFEIGDRDVLFVQKNGERMCPLLGWDHGRVRLVNGEVYDALGQELWLAPDGNFVRGPSRIDLTSPAHPLIANPSNVEPESAIEIPPGSLRADVCGFLAILHVRLSMLRIQPQYREPAVTQSADLGAPFRCPGLRAKKAPESHAAKPPRAKAEENDVEQH